MPNRQSLIDTDYYPEVGLFTDLSQASWSVTGYSEKWFPRIAVPAARVREADYTDMWLASRDRCRVRLLGSYVCFTSGSVFPFALNKLGHVLGCDHSLQMPGRISVDYRQQPGTLVQSLEHYLNRMV
jgi:hypothetical protein